MICFLNLLLANQTSSCSARSLEETHLLTITSCCEKTSASVGWQQQKCSLHGDLIKTDWAAPNYSVISWWRETLSATVSPFITVWRRSAAIGKFIQQKNKDRTGPNLHCCSERSKEKAKNRPRSATSCTHTSACLKHPFQMRMTKLNLCATLTAQRLKVKHINLKKYSASIRICGIFDKHFQTVWLSTAFSWQKLHLIHFIWWITELYRRTSKTPQIKSFGNILSEGNISVRSAVISLCLMTQSKCGVDQSDCLVLLFVWCDF